MFFVTPILLFSTIKYTLAISIPTNVLAFFVLKLTFVKVESYAVSVIIGLTICLFSAFSLLLYEKLTVKSVWSEIKMSLSNSELLQVVNASNQGVLIYCSQTNRLLLENATARKMFSNLQNSAMHFYGESLLKDQNKRNQAEP